MVRRRGQWRGWCEPPVTPEDEGVPAGYVRALFDLTGLRAVVTGAGSGLGAAIAIGLAQAGCELELVDLKGDGAERTRQVIESQGNAARAWTCDVTQAAELARLEARIRTSAGAADILVNSAGIAFRAPAEDFPEEMFDSVLAVNLKGTYLACQAFGRPMLERGSGSIINLASIGAFRVYPQASAYLAAKGGIVQLTRSLALEWGPRGVRVNGIGPTLIETEMTRQGAARSSVTSDYIMAHMPRPRLGQPRELVGAAIFLAGPASSLVNGHIVMCDDGYLAT